MRVYFMRITSRRSFSPEMRAEVEHQHMPLGVARHNLNRSQIDLGLDAGQRAHNGANHPAMSDDQYALGLFASRRIDAFQRRDEATFDAPRKIRAVLTLGISVRRCEGIGAPFRELDRMPRLDFFSGETFEEPKMDFDKFLDDDDVRVFTGNYLRAVHRAAERRRKDVIEPVVAKRDSISSRTEVICARPSADSATSLR